MPDISLIDFTPISILYAETHYRFRYFPFSLYYRKFPEVIFDAPCRIEPGCPLPVYLIVKDANQFPSQVVEVSIRISNGDSVIEKKFILNQLLNEPVWHRIFHVDVNDVPSGLLNIESKVVINKNGKLYSIRNDNHPGLSHKSLETFKAEHPLPSLADWYAGELHCHTDYGGDQVEFGAPLPVYQDAARAMGLSWVALTDHSYNLDDYLDNYLKDDPDLLKWQEFLQETERMNRNSPDVKLISGEELSCRSDLGKNIHLLLIGQKNFLRGTGDDAQKWLRTRSELSLDEAVSQADRNVAVIAAHPLEKVNFLERILLNRDRWTSRDLTDTGVHGWQISNGSWNSGFKSGFRLWTESLLNGTRKYIFAGNDAHGNLNRFRQVNLPMIRLWENRNHLFGIMTTRVRIPEAFDASKLTEAMRTGRSSISDGPALELMVEQNGKKYFSGDQVNLGSGGVIEIEYKSSPEFGEISQLRALTAQTKSEIQLDQFKIDQMLNSNRLSGKIRIPLSGQKYIRAELLTSGKKGSKYRSFSNPIWLN